MNKPVAWISRLPEGDVYNCAWAEKQNDDDIPLYTHPVKKLNKAVEIIKDFQNDEVPTCKYYEDTYADGWMDACNEILWAIEDELNGKAQEK